MEGSAAQSANDVAPSLVAAQLRIWRRLAARRRSPRNIAHPAMKRHLLAAAGEGIPYQLATTINRGSTEAGLMHMSREGIPMISVGVPRRYSYSPHEMIDLNDAAAAVNLIVQFVRDMERHNDLGFL
jgi:putative aminopeptidase FrvX